MSSSIAIAAIITFRDACQALHIVLTSIKRFPCIFKQEYPLYKPSIARSVGAEHASPFRQRRAQGPLIWENHGRSYYTSFPKRQRHSDVVTRNAGKEWRDGICGGGG
ncbi:hypothetical protein IG631_03664 [Alternaria alternata]|nr:hypothetical protein IG631_03664 [Alternaria alternata]